MFETLRYNVMKSPKKVAKLQLLSFTNGSLRGKRALRNVYIEAKALEFRKPKIACNGVVLSYVCRVAPSMRNVFFFSDSVLLFGFFFQHLLSNNIGICFVILQSTLQNGQMRFRKLQMSRIALQRNCQNQHAVGELQSAFGHCNSKAPAQS